jgi:hypothetical protein
VGDGIDDDLDITADSITDDLTVTVVFQSDDTASNFTLMGEDGNTNYIKLTNDTTITIMVNGTAVSFTVPAMGTTAHMLVVTRDSEGYVRVRLDSVESATGAVSLPGTFVIEKLFSHGSEFFEGRIGDVFVKDSALQVNERARLEEILTTKYGL